jgi:diacylglycerol kinase (ATP)
MNRALLVHNPTAGRFKIGLGALQIAVVLRDNGFEVDLWSTAERGTAVEAGRYAARERHGYLIAIGGDGTLHQVVNGLAEEDYSPCLGLIPTGTTNDFANHFSIPTSPWDALKVILKKKIHYIDLGKANDQYILYVVAGGSISNASYQATKSEKRVLGRFAYLIRGAREIFTYRPFHLKVTSEDVQFEGNVSLFVIGNTSCLGGVRNLIPEADPTDGLFNVVIVKDVDIPEALEVADYVLNKGTLTHPKVISFCANRLRVESRDNIQLSYDGEAGDFLPIDFKVVPNKIRVLLP